LTIAIIAATDLLLFLWHMVEKLSSLWRPSSLVFLSIVGWYREWAIQQTFLIHGGVWQLANCALT